MNTDKKRTKVYLALVPHKETRQTLKKYCYEAVKNGLKDVYEFPFIAPLIELERPMKGEELKKYAHKLRLIMGDKKFSAFKTNKTTFKLDDKELILYGLQLDWNTKLSSYNNDMIKNNNPAPYSLLPLPYHLIGLFLFSENIQIALPSPPYAEFRAAAVANFYIKQIDSHGNTGFKWRIGNLYWLPKKIR